METRNVNITLKKAKEWYKKGGDLKEVALQAFTEEELTALKFTDIKTFEDACKALNLNMNAVNANIYNVRALGFQANTTDHLIAIYKLDIIRKALNEDWKPSLIQGGTYYPYVKFYPAGKEAREAASRRNLLLGKSFIADGQKFTLVGGDDDKDLHGGLTDFGYGYGAVIPTLSLLCCKSKEIAEHMSRYFAKEIFEATHAQHIGTYKWV